MPKAKLDPTINLIEWIVGEHYLAVTCKHCGWEFPFVRAFDQLPESPIEIGCIECDGSAYYCPREFERVQAR